MKIHFLFLVKSRLCKNTEPQIFENLRAILQNNERNIESERTKKTHQKY